MLVNPQPPTAPAHDGTQPPSTYAIQALVNGEPGAFQRVVGLTLLRTALILPGLWVAGKAFREESFSGPKLIGSSFLASTTITLGMYGFAFVKTKMRGDLSPVHFDGPPPAPNYIDTTAEPLR